MGVDELLQLARGRLTLSVPGLDPEQLRRIEEGPRNLPPIDSAAASRSVSSAAKNGRFVAVTRISPWARRAFATR